MTIKEKLETVKTNKKHRVFILIKNIKIRTMKQKQQFH